MVTSLEMLTNSYQAIGVYAPGEPISAADSQLGLDVMNAMFDSWSNERLISFANATQSATLVPGQYQYTIGTTGSPDLNMTRPIRILSSPGTCYIVDTNGNVYNMEVLPQDRWNMIGNIANVNSNFPNVLFYDPQYPLGIINVWPIPTTGYTLYFDSPIQLSNMATLSAVLSLPPGYQKAIQDQMRVELWPYFKSDQAQIPPLLLRLAADSKGNIKRSNQKEVIANFDPELIRAGQSIWNPYTDSPRGPV